MITIQHVMQLVARTVHHCVDDAQVGDKFIGALLVADVVVATQEMEFDAHLSESVLGVVNIPIDRTGKGGMTKMLACAADHFRSPAIPAGGHLREQLNFCLDA